MLYSKTTLGFYDPLINKGVPDDAVEVLDEDYRALFEAQAIGHRIVPNAVGYPVSVAPEPPTYEQKVKAFTDLIQSLLDGKAREFGYDDIKTAVTYADEPAVAKFQQEGMALRAWRSQVWAFGYAWLAEVEAGTRPEPTPEEILMALPAFT